MPEHPADDPVLFLYTFGVTAKIVDLPRLPSGVVVYADDLAVDRALTDLRIGVRRLDFRIVSKLWC